MKGWIWSLAATAAVASFAIAFWSKVDERAPRNNEGRAVALQGGTGDRIVASESVAVEGRMAGDLAAAGSSVTVSAPVDGYVLAAAGDVAIDADVRDDLWAAGGNVTVSAPVGDSARLAGGVVRVENGADIGGGAALAGGTVVVRAPVGGDLAVSGGEVALDAEVAGNVIVRSERLLLEPNARIRGDLRIAGPAPEMMPGAVVEGQVDVVATDLQPGLVGWLGRWLFGFLALLALGFIVVGPTRWASRVSARIGDRFGASLLAGIAALVFAPFLIALFAATIVGIPLAVVVLALFTASAILSGVFVSLRIGGWSLQRLDRLDASRYACLAAGALILSLLASLPWVGWITWVGVAVIGVGALVIERRDTWRERAPAAQPA